jgi:hypothetical protein
MATEWRQNAKAQTSAYHVYMRVRATIVERGIGGRRENRPRELSHPNSLVHLRFAFDELYAGARVKATESTDVMYDTDTLNKASFAATVAASQRKYAVLQSRTDRWPKVRRPTHTAPIAERLVAQGLDRWRRCKERTTRSFFQGESATAEVLAGCVVQVAGSAAGAALGPGAYDTQCAMDLRKDWAQRPLSSFQSKV